VESKVARGNLLSQILLERIEKPVFLFLIFFSFSFNILAMVHLMIQMLESIFLMINILIETLLYIYFQIL